MQENKERTYSVGEDLYVVTCWGNGRGENEAITAKGSILRIEKNGILVLLLHGDTGRGYSIYDHGRLFFDTEEDAEDAATKLPKPGEELYIRKSGKRVKVKTLAEKDNQGCVTDLLIKTRKHGAFEMDAMDVCLFRTREEALKAK